MISLWLNPEDHLRTLSLVLERLRFAGSKMNKTKWKFLQQSVVYLGQKLNGEGLQPTDDKVAATRDAPRAKHVTTFKSFLGLIMYVLFTVHATSFHCTVTSSQSAQEIYPLDVVQNWRRCIVTGFWDISILWSHAVPVPFTWCFILRWRSCSISQDWWAISTRGLCFCYFDKCPTKIVIVRKGGSEYHFWIKTILPVFAWQF